MSFQLPLQELPNFEALFKVLDDKLDELNIASYGISITTLEEVFLKVAEGDNINPQRRFSRLEKEVEKVDDFDLNSVKVKRKIDLFFIHFWALMVKRWDYFKRDKKGLVCEIILPCIVIVLGLCLTFIKFLYPSPALELSPELLIQPLNTPVQNNLGGFYGPDNFPGNYFKWITSPSFDNTDIAAFNNFSYNERNADGHGLYGAYFLESSLNQNYTYYSFVFFL